MSFTGTTFNIFGIVLDFGTPVASFTVDGGLPRNFTMPLSNASFPVFNWNFISQENKFESEEGLHNITVTTLYPDSNPLYIDYILITASKAYVPMPALLPISTASISPSPIYIGKNHSNAGAIAGGVVGGAALLGFALIMLSITRRKHR